MSSLTADELTEQCRRELARYKVPEQFRFAAALPRNSMAKVDRAAVRAWFAEEG